MPADDPLRLTSASGLEELLFLDAPDEPRAAVLILPAMGVAARYYRTFAATLVAAGVAAARAEYPGHGKSPYRAGRDFDYGYRDVVETSIPLWVGALRERWPSTPIFVLGHSLGGHLTLLYGSLPDADAEGLILVASGSVDYRSWKKIGQGYFRARYGTQIVAFVARALGYWPGDRFGFAGREARTLVADWAHFARHGRWRLKGSTRDWMTEMARVETPLLAISLDLDDLAPRGPVDDHVALMPRADLTRIHLDERDAAPQTLTHFRWALDPAPVAERVIAWMERRIGGA